MLLSIFVVIHQCLGVSIDWVRIDHRKTESRHALLSVF